MFQIVIGNLESYHNIKDKIEEINEKKEEGKNKNKKQMLVV